MYMCHFTSSFSRVRFPPSSYDVTINSLQLLSSLRSTFFRDVDFWGGGKEEMIEQKRKYPLTKKEKLSISFPNVTFPSRYLVDQIMRKLSSCLDRLILLTLQM